MKSAGPFSQPVDAYKTIIDQLVAETSHGVSESLVTEERIFSKSASEGAANAFVQSLSAEDRATLVKMLHTERTSAIHDVLSVLSWWTQAGGVGLTYQGEPMPTDLSGMGMHGDYVGRRFDWDWPNDNPTQDDG